MNGTKTVVLKSGCGTLRSVSLSTVRKTGDGKPTHGKSRCGQSSSLCHTFSSSQISACRAFSSATSSSYQSLSAFVRLRRLIETGSLSTIPNFIKELLLFSLSAFHFTIRRRKVQPRSAPISALRRHDKRNLRKAQEGLQERWRQRRDPPRHRPWPALSAGAEKRGAARRSPFSLFRRFFHPRLPKK